MTCFSDHQCNMQRYSAYYHVKQRTAESRHTEDGSRNILGAFVPLTVIE